jgi:hypothetical protein
MTAWARHTNGLIASRPRHCGSGGGHMMGDCGLAPPWITAAWDVIEQRAVAAAVGVS